jgi:hypothetical protein
MAAPHVLAVPRGILVLRMFQIVIAVIILGLSAYGIYWIAFGVRTNVTAQPFIQFSYMELTGFSSPGAWHFSR